MKTSITNRIASDRNVKVWIAPETTPGDIAWPGVGDFVSAFDIAYPTQVPEYTNSEEKAPTRDVIDRCQGRMPAGEWGFSCYARPAGLGIVPTEGLLLFAMAGKETVDPGVDVQFDPDIIKQSFTLWMLVDHTMLFCVGATVGAAELNLDSCSLTYQFTGNFMRMGATGTDPLTGLVSPADTVINVTDADKYSIDGVFALTDAAGDIVDDNGGIGYVVLDNDNVAETITTAGIIVGAPADGFVVPFDAGGKAAGNPLKTSNATVSLGGEIKPVVGFTWTNTDEPEYLDREKTPSGFPESYAETQREVGGEIVLLFRREEAAAFKRAFDDTQQAIILHVGDTEGYQVKINMARCQVDIPTIDEAAPVVETTLPFTALATVGEDSYKVTYQ